MRRLLLVAALIVLGMTAGATHAANWHSQQREPVKTEALQSTAVPAVISTTTSTTTTVAPTTTLPPVHKVIRAPARAEPTRGTTSVPTSGDVWERLAQCESGMRNVASGTYRGYFQFLPSTWRSMGETGMPNDHDYATQKAAAQRLVARSGWNQFPACGRRLGMR